METTIGYIINGLTVVLLGAFGFFAKNMISDFKNRIEKVECKQEELSTKHNNELNEVRSNYLSKFADAKQTQYDVRDELKSLHQITKDEIITAINQMKLEIVKLQGK